MIACNVLMNYNYLNHFYFKNKTLTAKECFKFSGMSWIVNDIRTDLYIIYG